MNGTVEHAAKVGARDGAAVHADTDEAPRELVHDDKDPVEECAPAIALANTRSLRVVPIILRDAPLPGFLASRQHVDFRDDLAFEANVDRLVSGIEDIPSQLTGASPQKRRCILDRRLATMMVAIAQRGTENSTQTEELDAIGIAVSMFEAILIESVFGSAVAATLAKNMPSLAEAVVFLEPLDDDPTVEGHRRRHCSDLGNVAGASAL